MALNKKTILGKFAQRLNNEYEFTKFKYKIATNYSTSRLIYTFYRFSLPFASLDDPNDQEKKNQRKYEEKYHGNKRILGPDKQDDIYIDGKKGIILFEYGNDSRRIRRARANLQDNLIKNYFINSLNGEQQPNYEQLLKNEYFKKMARSYERHGIQDYLIEILKDGFDKNTYGNNALLRINRKDKDIDNEPLVQVTKKLPAAEIAVNDMCCMLDAIYNSKEIKKEFPQNIADKTNIRLTNKDRAKLLELLPIFVKGNYKQSAFSKLMQDTLEKSISTITPDMFRAKADIHSPIPTTVKKPISNIIKIVFGAIALITPFSSLPAMLFFVPSPGHNKFPPFVRLKNLIGFNEETKRFKDLGDISGFKVSLGKDHVILREPAYNNKEISYARNALKKQSGDEFLTPESGGALRFYINLILQKRPNLKETSLEDILKAPAYQDFIKTYKNADVKQYVLNDLKESFESLSEKYQKLIEKSEKRKDLDISKRRSYRLYNALELDKYTNVEEHPIYKLVEEKLTNTQLAHSHATTIFYAVEKYLKKKYPNNFVTTKEVKPAMKKNVEKDNGIQNPPDEPSSTREQAR